MADLRDEIEQKLNNVYRAMAGQVRANKQEAKRYGLLLNIYEKKLEKAQKELDPVNEVTAQSAHAQNRQRIRNLQLKIATLQEAKAQAELNLHELGRGNE